MPAGASGTRTALLGPADDGEEALGSHTTGQGNGQADVAQDAPSALIPLAGIAHCPCSTGEDDASVAQQHHRAVDSASAMWSTNERTRACCWCMR